MPGTPYQRNLYPNYNISKECEIHLICFTNSYNYTLLDIAVWQYHQDTCTLMGTVYPTDVFVACLNEGG